MKLHTTAFKEQIKEMGRELDSIITFGDTVLGSEQLNAVTPSFQSSILKSAMKQLDIDSNVPIPIGTVLNYKFGVKINEEYEYIDFGNYIVKEIEKQEDTMSYKITCYDKMLLTMKDYAEIPITYPITIRNYINSLCIFLGLSFANKNDEFANYGKEIPNELYLDRNGKSLGYTFRDVFDELAQVTASTICINNNDEVEVRYITDTEDTIDEEYLKNINVNFGEKYGKVNSIVLSRSGESDNIYLRDETSVEENGLTELKIVDNQIMNFNNRVDYLPDILEKLNGLEYYINDFSSTGITYYDICDRYNVKIGENTYSCVMFNDEILITQGLEENIYTEIPEETETDYKKASKTDRLINQTNLIVDKQLGEIRGIVEEVETTVENITTTTQTSKGGNHLYLEDAMESNALEYIVEGKSEQETSTQSSNILAMTDKTFRSKTTNVNDYTINGYNTITINGIGGSTYRNVTFNIPSSLLEEGATYYLGGMTESFTSPSSYVQFGINEIEISTGTRTAYAEAKFTSSELNTNKSVNMTIKNLDTYRYDLRLYPITNVGGTTEDITSVVFKDLYLSKINKYEPFIPDSPSPDYPSEIKTVKGIRNLFDINSMNTNNSLTTGTVNGNSLILNGQFWYSYTIENLKENTDYFISADYKIITNSGVSTIGKIRVDGVQSGSVILSSRYPNGTFNTGTNTSIIIYFYVSAGSSYDAGEVEFSNIQLEQGSIRHSFVPYGSWLEVKDTGKNLLPSNILSKQTINGITFTPNEDGTVTANGTATATATYRYFGVDTITPQIVFDEETIISFSQEGSSTTYAMAVWGLNANGNNIGKAIYTDTTYTKGFQLAGIGLRVFKDATVSNLVFKPMIRLVGDTNNTYEPYKEQSTLIDMNKPNLFDNVAFVEGSSKYYSYDETTGITINKNDEYAWSSIGYKIQIGNNKQYKISVTNIDDYSTLRFGQFKSDGTWITAIYPSSDGLVTFNSDCSYVTLKIIPSEFPKTIGFITLISGCDDYYELPSINDTKDILTIQNKQATINQRIGKYVITSVMGTRTNGSGETLYQATVVELKDMKVGNWSKGYCDKYKVGNWVKENNVIRFGANDKHIHLYTDDENFATTESANAYLSNNPVIIYYILDEPQTIELGDFPIMLYNNINNVTLMSDLDTTTQITYLRNTPLSNDYATNQRVDKTDSDLEQTNNSLNQTKQDVENTAVDLHNNYYDKEQIDSIITTTEEEITTLKQTVETNTSSTNLQISVIEEQLKNGVTAVKTETGYTFDKNGLNISKTGSEMSSTLDNDGLSVKRDNTEVLTVRSAGVETENLKVRTYFTIGSHTRVEDYGNGTGFFHIGGV